MKKKRILKRLLALVLITALCVQTVSTRFFSTAYAADNLSAETENLQLTDESNDETRTVEAPVTVLGEVESLRTEDEKHFRMSDGTYMAVSYGMAVHYEDEDGLWQDIDNRMVLLTDQATYRTYNLESTTDFSASLTSGSLFETSHDGTSVSMSLLDTEQANRIMAQYAAQLERQTGTGSNVLQTEELELSVSAQAELQAKIQLVEEALSAGNTLLTYDRTAAADTSVTVPTMVNTGSVGNTGDSRVGWTMEDILPDNLQSSILYEDVFPNIDLLYTKYSHHVKEQIIVNAPQSSYRYDFALNLDGVDAVQNEDGSINLVNEADEVLYYIPAPFMQDADGVISYEVEYVLTPSADGVILSVVADADWMNDEERAYPVAIDPTVRVMQYDQARANIYSSYVVEGQPNSAYGGSSTLTAGWTQWNNLATSLIFLHFNTLPALPAGSIVTDAYLDLYMTSFSGAGLSELGIALYPLNEDRPSADTSYFNWVTFFTWNNMPLLNENNIVDYATVSSAKQGSNIRWDMTELVKDWYINGTANRTIALGPAPGVTYGSGASANASFYAWNTTNPPVLAVTYRDQTGIEPYYTYRTMGVENAGTVYLADATGQVKIVKNVASYASTINPFSMNLVYNSDYFAASTSADYQPPTQMGTGNIAMKLGQGWTLDIIQTMTTTTIDGEEYICYHDGDGTKHYFRKDTVEKDTTGTYYFDEDGLGLKVKKTTSGFEMSDDHGNSWIFTSNRLTQTKDANGNIYTINYSNNKITSVVQTNNGMASITVATFAYSGDYVSSITDAAGNVYELVYSGENLSRLKLNQTTIAGYNYSGNRIYYLWDCVSWYELDFTFSKGKCSYFCEYDEDAADGDGDYGMLVNVSYSGTTKTTYQYGGNDRRLNTSDDIYTSYLFDHSGRTINAYTTDVNNNLLGATNAVYTVDDTETGTDKKNNRIEQTASIGAATYDLLYNGGFEDTTYAWTLSNATRSTEKARTGQYSLKGSSTSVSATRQTRSLTANTTYTVSAYVNTSAVTAANFSVYLKVTDTAGNTFQGSAYNNGGVNYTTISHMDEGWIRIQHTFTAKTSGVHTVAVVGNSISGSFYVDDVQLEADDAAGSVNLLENGDFEVLHYGWAGSTYTAYTTGTGWNSSYGMQIISNPTAATSYVSQTVPIYLSGKQTYVLSGWVKANAVPDNMNAAGVNENQDVYKQCGLRAVITYSDNSTEYHYVPFDADISGEWQYVSAPIVPEKSGLTVNTIKVICAYERNANKAYFDNISLVRAVVQRSAYNSDGNPETAESTGQNGEAYTYNSDKELQTVETGGNGTFTYGYDTTNKHRLTSTTDGVITQTLDHDTAGNVTTTILSSSNTSNPLRIYGSSAYTNSGNLLYTVTDALGNKVTYTYANALNKAYGLPSSVKDPMNVTTSMLYDSFGRTTQTAISGTAQVNYTYDSNVLTQILRTNSSSGTQTYTFGYNGFEQLTSVKVGTRALVTHAYGSYKGSLVSSTFGNGSTVSYTYDILGRVIQETHSSGRTVTYHYNSEGHLTRTVDRSNVTYYTYDELGRMIMSYDGYMGARTRYTYDANDRLIEAYRGTTGKGTYVWSDTYETYTYNANESDTISDGTLTGMRMLTGANISLGYDYLQRLTTRTTASALTETYAYTAGNGTNRTTVLVSGKINTLGGSVKNNFTYTYDANGNIKTVTDSANSRSITYTYDNQGQLLKAVHSDGRTETYSYDSVGNILTFNNGSISHSYTYGDSNWKDLLTKVDGVSLVYDANGNPTTYYNGSSYTLNWTEGRKLYMAGTGGTQTYYSYNMDGLRRTKIYSDESGINYIIVDGRIVGEEHFDSNEDVTAYIRYTFDENGSVCGYSVSANGTSWTNYYFIKNLQGDVLQVFQAGTNTVVATYTYDSWGNILSATGSQAHVNPFRYRGYYYDEETGFYCLSSRYYDPEVGRFINADGYVSTGQGIIGHNMFAYCGNNPIVRIDADGTRWKIILKFALHVGNIFLVALGYDTAAFGASFLNMSKDSSGVYHADFNCWQQYFGYNSFYDWMFDAGTSMKSAKFSFVYNGSGYTIWAWKGDYINLGAGAELGIYRGNSGHRTVDKSLAMQMSMTLKYKGKTIISYYPSERQWWITGFNPKYLNVSASDLTATFTLRFNSSGMFYAFRSKYSWDSRWRFYTNGYYATFQF